MTTQPLSREEAQALVDQLSDELAARYERDLSVSPDELSDEPTYVRWHNSETDRINRFPNRRVAEDFAHDLAEMGYSICIGPKEFVMLNVLEETPEQARTRAQRQVAEHATTMFDWMTSGGALEGRMP